MGSISHFEKVNYVLFESYCQGCTFSYPLLLPLADTHVRNEQNNSDSTVNSHMEKY